MDEMAPRKPLDIAGVYERYRCPAEILIPFRVRKVPGTLLGAWWEAGVVKPRSVTLWNMDFPWLLVIGTALVSTLLSAVILSWARWLMHSNSGLALFLSVLGAFPIVFAGLGFLLYPIFVTLNMRLGWGKNWRHTLLGPTHIGITDSGFKLYVRGWFFYNYPNLALWQEIFEADLISDRRKNSLVLRFTYQTGFGRAPIDLPLDAFESAADLQFVLKTFADNVFPQYQGPLLKAMAKVNFAPVLEGFEQGQLYAIGLDLARQAKAANAIEDLEREKWQD
jgi:hypothetical protein